MSHGGGRPQGSRNSKSKGPDRQAGAIKVAVSTAPRIGGGFFNSMQAEGKQKFKMEVGKIYRLMFDPDDDLREVDASEVGTRDEGQGLPSACSRLQNEPGRGRSRG